MESEKNMRKSEKSFKLKTTLFELPHQKLKTLED